MSRTLAENKTIPPVCRICNYNQFKPITGGSGRLRCCKCGWLIICDERGQRDALDIARAGRKRVGK